MSVTASWILILLGLAAAAIAGFFVGRHTSPGRHEAESLKAALERQRQEMADYRQSVNRHFEKTATLFTSMAGSYRDLYDHLSESYATLADAPAQRLLPERPGALLEGGRPAPRAPVVPPAPPEPHGHPPETAPSRTPLRDEDLPEDMMGDAPHIPDHVPLEEPPEQPVIASRDAEEPTSVEDASLSAVEEPAGNDGPREEAERRERSQG